MPPSPLRTRVAMHPRAEAAPTAGTRGWSPAARHHRVRIQTDRARIVSGLRPARASGSHRLSNHSQEVASSMAHRTIRLALNVILLNQLFSQTWGGSLVGGRAAKDRVTRTDECLRVAMA